MRHDTCSDPSVTISVRRFEPSRPQGVQGITKHVAPDGTAVYRLPFEHDGSGPAVAYLVLNDAITLVHTLSDAQGVLEALADAFSALRERFGERVARCDVGRTIRACDIPGLMGPTGVAPEDLPAVLERYRQRVLNDRELTRGL